MKTYIGTKIIIAEPMKLGEYNTFKGWQIPKGEDPDREGYKVVYSDGYVSWSPKEAFESSYRLSDGLTFGLAIDAMKLGHKVSRIGWNGKGMFLYLVSADIYPAKMPAIKGVFADDKVPYGAYIAMKTAQGNVVPWLASQTDMLGEDYIIVD
jgi:Protein of unknown function (DUF2829).